MQHPAGHGQRADPRGLRCPQLLQGAVDGGLGATVLPARLGEDGGDVVDQLADVPPGLWR